MPIAMKPSKKLLQSLSIVQDDLIYEHVPKGAA